MIQYAGGEVYVKKGGLVYNIMQQKISCLE